MCRSYIKSRVVVMMILFVFMLQVDRPATAYTSSSLSLLNHLQPEPRKEGDRYQGCIITISTQRYYSLYTAITNYTLTGKPTDGAISITSRQTRRDGKSLHRTSLDIFLRHLNGPPAKSLLLLLLCLFHLPLFSSFF